MNFSFKHLRKPELLHLFGKLYQFVFVVKRIHVFLSYIKIYEDDQECHRE